MAIGDIADNIATVTVNGDEYKVEMEPEAEPEKKKVVVKTGAAKESAPEADAPAASGPVNTANALKAPLPGVITEIKVAVGDKVKTGDPIVILEAMKMENPIPAPKDGTVTSVLVEKGATVEVGQVLVTIQ